ncbi:methyltransferase domain-containing protein [bacterium]|nr:methyltransferase domain-containing protein [bacterium]
MPTSDNRRDYAAITEVPDSGLSQEQFLRMAHRYRVAADLAEGRRVLEIACGAGIGLGLLQRRAQQLWAVDYSSSVLQQAQRHYGAQIPFVHADAQDLPFANHVFDLVLCFEAIYYLADLGRFLCECQRVLAPNGLLLISTSNPDWPNFVPGVLTTHYPVLPEMTEALHASGFDNIQCNGILPATQQRAADRLRNRLRALVMKNPFLAQSLQRIPLLKVLAYRGLIPLGAELTEADLAISLPVSPLSPNERDESHRVLYFQAQVMG